MQRACDPMDAGPGRGGLTLHPALYTLRARPPGRLLRQPVQAGPRFIVIYNEPGLVKLIFTRDTGDPSTAKVNFIYARRPRCKWSAIKPARRQCWRQFRETREWGSTRATMFHDWCRIRPIYFYLYPPAHCFFAEICFHSLFWKFFSLNILFRSFVLFDLLYFLVGDFVRLIAR